MQAYRRPIPFWMEIEEEWMGQGVDGKVEGMRGEEEGEWVGM